MRKVIIIGCPESGKSKFARALNAITSLPLFHLDNMKWNADKTVVSKSTFMERLNIKIKKEKWIIDGNYRSTMELRLQACDTVFFLDYFVEVCLRGIEERKGKKDRICLGLYRLMKTTRNLYPVLKTTIL